MLAPCFLRHGFSVLHPWLFCLLKINSKKEQSESFCSSLQYPGKAGRSPSPNSGRGSDCHFTPHTPLNYLKNFLSLKNILICVNFIIKALTLENTAPLPDSCKARDGKGRKLAQLTHNLI